MTALTKDKDVHAKETGRSIDVPLAANAIIFAGAMVSSNATGFGVAASDTTGEVVRGIAEEAADNTGGSDGDLTVRCRLGVFELLTVGTVVDQADMGRPVYVSDDATIEKIAGVTNNIIAGTLDSLDPETGNPWVAIFDPRS